jgi:hypothetical protein
MTITDRSQFDPTVSLGRWRQALGFICAAGLNPVGSDSQQIEPCRTSYDVDRLAAIGFTPHRFTHEGAQLAGMMELYVAGVHIFAACDGHLLDYAETVAS